MSRRTQLFMLLTLVVVLVLVAILIFLRFNKNRPEPIATPTGQTTETPAEEPPASPPPAVIEEQETRTKTASVQTLAKTFVERYGSFSTEANYQNLRDVQPLMIPSFVQATEQQIATMPAATEYYGVTTKVITVTVSAMDESAGTAAVSVSTQRQEAKGSPQNISLRYQTVDLTLQKISGEWKVASATWGS